MTARSPRKSKGRGFERREEILACAQVLLDTQGGAAVTTRSIALAAGLSQPTLYAYFTSKDDIIEVLVARAFDRLHCGLVHEAGDAVAAKQALVRTFEGVAEFGLANPALYRAAFGLEMEPLQTVSLGARLTLWHNQLRRWIEMIDPAEPGRRQRAARLATSLMAGVHGLILLLSAAPDLMQRPPLEVIRDHVRLLLGAASGSSAAA